jgi:outer membrane protein OmpA-like peptidoglycan-associated protein
MAERPPQQNQSEDSAAETREDKRQKFQDLRNLLLAPEQKEIESLRNRMDDRAARAEDLSAVVAESIELRRAHGGGADLNKALMPSVEEALRESVRKDPSVLAGALFPVMGPAIRKSIAESIRSMLESFNQTMDHSLSVQGVRWRLESLRTGRPFSEVVLLHSLVYRVEQVFLIHKATSLLLAHCVAPHVSTKDPSLVSGMLSAIQSYVRDSFKAPKEDSLDSIQVGDLEVWVVSGPQAILAAVIRGHAPASYRATLEKTIEDIHRDFGRALEEFDGDSAAFAAVEQRLEALLESHYEPKKASKRWPYVAVVAAVAVIALVLAVISLAMSVYNGRKWNQFMETLRREPGIVVRSSGMDRGHHLVRLLHDPLAKDPSVVSGGEGIAPESVEFKLEPYYSFDDDIVQKRAIEMLVPPRDVSCTVKDGVLIATGRAPSEWVRTMKERAALVPGVKGVDDTHLESSEASETQTLAAELKSTVFTFPVGVAQVDADQEGKFASAAQVINALIAKTSPLSQPVMVEVIGHTDTSGTEGLNMSLSQQRAEYVTRKLIEAGVARRNLAPRGVGTSEPVRNHDAAGDESAERSVTLRLVPAKPNRAE